MRTLALLLALTLPAGPGRARAQALSACRRPSGGGLVAQRLSDFSASLMPSLTPTPAGSAFRARPASFSL